MCIRDSPLRFPLGGREFTTVVCQLASVVYLLSLFAHPDGPAGGDDQDGLHKEFEMRMSGA
ncbi:hypothetical protein E2562_030415 [Oryza meyeriana var. granulata]|uniref:Uncharacterized protein n=1 Tax=Oryza meyeriana var. granulata TaxID=110450 RepID=A0A6G1FDU9_9ORYZ|nr:hypothetical protein E2562_030415 [Oryza meyeriana var. granulata]